MGNYLELETNLESLGNQLDQARETELKRKEQMHILESKNRELETELRSQREENKSNLETLQQLSAEAEGNDDPNPAVEEMKEEGEEVAELATSQSETLVNREEVSGEGKEADLTELELVKNELKEAFFIIRELESRISEYSALTTQDAESFSMQKREWLLRNDSLSRSLQAKERENEKLRMNLEHIKQVMLSAEGESVALHQQLSETKKRAMEADMLAVNLTLAQGEIRDREEENRLLQLEVGRQGLDQQSRHTLIITELKNQLRQLSEETDYKDMQVHDLVTKIHQEQMVSTEALNEADSSLTLTLTLTLTRLP